MTQEQLYKIGEVARLLDVNTSVLRYWETEFAQLAPIRTEGGQRLYTPNHMALLQEIRRLLYDERLTIQGARQALELRFPAPPQQGGATQLALIDMGIPPPAAPAQSSGLHSPPAGAEPEKQPAQPRTRHPATINTQANNRSHDLLLLDIAAELRAIRRLLEDE